MFGPWPLIAVVGAIGYIWWTQGGAEGLFQPSETSEPPVVASPEQQAILAAQLKAAEMSSPLTNFEGASWSAVAYKGDWVVFAEGGKLLHDLAFPVTANGVVGRPMPAQVARAIVKTSGLTPSSLWGTK